MLQQKAADNCRQGQPPPIHKNTKPEPEKRDRGRVGFQSSLNVPLTPQLSDPGIDHLAVSTVKTFEAFKRFATNAFVDSLGGVPWDTLGSVRNERLGSHAQLAAMPVPSGSGTWSHHGVKLMFASVAGPHSVVVEARRNAAGSGDAGEVDPAHCGLGEAATHRAQLRPQVLA